jgi:hypothetical protein
MDCPLCLEEMDVSDLNFKPCPCGYQVRFQLLLAGRKGREAHNNVDLSVLLPSHQREPEWEVSGLSSAIR